MQKKNSVLSQRELSSFCSQMSMILRSGISSLEGITLMMEETDQETDRQILQKIYDGILETGSFASALRESGVFPDYCVEMSEVGEMTGKLDEAMGSLAQHYDREASIAQSVRNAVIYPGIMIVMMLAVILILLTKVMPVFEQVFQQLGTEMTGLSLAILNAGKAISSSSALLIVLIAVVVALLIYLAKSKKGRLLLTSFLTRRGGSKGYAQMLAACRFADGMAMTLSSGLSPEESLNYAEKLTSNPVFSRKIAECRRLTEEGEPLSKALTQAGIFTGPYARMASIASKAGMLDEVMADIADQYQEELDQRLSAIIGGIEPALVIVLSVIVGMILMSVMLPLAGILSGL